MTTDEEIRQQSYELFRNEAPDLLEQVEIGIYNIQDDHSKPTVHNLMRATHTLKGAAANVGRDTIKQIAHQLEEVFGALLSEKAIFDGELEILLFDIYECLRVAYNNEVEGDKSTDTQNLQRAAEIFVQLQEKLGDCFNEEPMMLSSSELGFDMTKSVFEVGVKQRIAEIEAILQKTNDPEQIAQAVKSQMTVFVGLAESLSLEGFKAIAQTALEALEQHPKAAEDITVEVINNLHSAREAVLNGDRDQGGEPSEILKGFTEPLPTQTNFSETSLSLDDTFGAIKIDSQEHSLSLDDTFGAIKIDSQEDSFATQYLTSDIKTDLNPPETQADEKKEEIVLTAPQPETSHSPDLEAAQLYQQSSTPRTGISIRVDLEQVETLNHLVGELSINQNLLSLRDEQYQSALQKVGGWLSQHKRTLFQLRDQLPAEDANTEFAQLLYTSLEENSQLEQALDDVNHLARTATSSVEREKRLSQELRDTLEGVRMLPIEKVLNRFPLMVKKLCASYQKEVRLKLSGVQVLVDKAITENLYDALLHLIRNAFDHGIETPQERQQQFKPTTGEITIHAYNQGNRTIVEVKDDGRGLNVEKICQRAIEKNLITPSQVETIRQSSHPEDKLLQVICQPGFSTVNQATDLSGRGIGLDVVYSQMQKINGAVTVESQLGKGTTFYLQIRGALMNARLLVCQAGNGLYSFIADEVEQVLIPETDQIKWLGTRKVLKWEQNLASKEESQSLSKTITIPIYPLSHLLAYQQDANYLLQTQATSDVTMAEEATLLTSDDETSPLLLLRTPNGLIALEIDSIIEEQELVLKPLSATVPPPSYAYGCTILPNGHLSLVLDGAALIDSRQADLNIPRALSPKTTPSSPKTSQPQLPYQRLIEDVTNPYGIHNTQEKEPENIHQTLAIPSADEPVKTDNEAKYCTLLVVDDSITERQTLSMIMQKAGHHVIQARDGQEAIEQLQKGLKVDLILCDLEMPRMNGLEFIGVTRQYPQLASIPVIVITSRTRDKYQRIALELGASDYLTKPYLDQELLSAVGKTMNN